MSLDGLNPSGYTSAALYKKENTMVSENLKKELNDQIRDELASAYAYLAMSLWAQSENFDGIARFFEVQSGEERAHARKFMNMLIDLGERVVIQEMKQPESHFASVREVFESALKHEQFITFRIHHLMGIAQKENAFEVQGMLQWFVDEQIEEENTMIKILAKLDLIGENKGLLLMLDRELGSRGE